MTKDELIKHLDQVLTTAKSEGAKDTIDHILDLRNLLKPQNTPAK